MQSLNLNQQESSEQSKEVLQIRDYSLLSGKIFVSFQLDGLGIMKLLYRFSDSYVVVLYFFNQIFGEYLL